MMPLTRFYSTFFKVKSHTEDIHCFLIKIALHPLWLQSRYKYYVWHYCFSVSFIEALMAQLLVMLNVNGSFETGNPSINDKRRSQISVMAQFCWDLLAKKYCLLALNSFWRRQPLNNVCAISLITVCVLHVHREQEESQAHVDREDQRLVLLSRPELIYRWRTW